MTPPSEPPLHAVSEPNAQHANVETVTPRPLQPTRAQLIGVILWGFLEVSLIVLLGFAGDLSRDRGAWRGLDTVLMYLGFVSVSLFLPCLYLLRPPSTLRATLRVLCLIFVALSLIPLGYALGYVPLMAHEAYSDFTRDYVYSKGLAENSQPFLFILWSVGGVLVRFILLPSLFRARGITPPPVTPHRLQLTHEQFIGVILWGCFEAFALSPLKSGVGAYESYASMLTPLGFAGLSLFIPCIYLLRSSSTLRATLRVLCLAFVAISLSPLVMELLWASIAVYYIFHGIFGDGHHVESKDVVRIMTLLLCSLGGVLVRLGLLRSLFRARSATA